MARVVPDVDADDFIRRYRSGETLKQLKAAFHVGHARALEILASRGMTPVSQGVRSRKLTDTQAAELVRRYLAGETMNELGPAFGISSRGVTDYLRLAKVQARPKWVGGMQAIEGMDPGILREKRSALMRERWSVASTDERSAMLAAAHAASRGVPQTLEQREKIAARKAQIRTSDSPYEEQVACWLRERGVSFVQQKAVGPYNLDFAIGNVAVEFTTGWARKKEWRPRLTRIFDEGWHLYVIWHDNANLAPGGGGQCDLLPCVADDFVAWLKILEASPALRCQHRVIWRSRQIFSAGSGDADYVARIFRTNAPLGRWPLYDGARQDA